MARSESIRGTRRSTLIHGWNESGIMDAVFLWLQRLGLFILAVIVLACTGLWFLMSDGNNYFQKKIMQKFMVITADMGYRIENILVEGRVYTDTQKVLDLIAAQKGDSVFKVDLVDISKELSKISWVKNVQVERRLPDTIYVRLEERQPFALWQQKDKLVLIDREGVTLTDKNLKKYKNLMMVRGNGAAKQAFVLSQMLNAEPEIMDRFDHAVWLEGRRWDLVFKDTKVVKLPEKDIVLALSNLVSFHKKDGIFDKPLTTLDARNPARLIVQTEIGKAQELSADAVGSKTGQSL